MINPDHTTRPSSSFDSSPVKPSARSEEDLTAPLPPVANPGRFRRSNTFHKTGDLGTRKLLSIKNPSSAPASPPESARSLGAGKSATSIRTSPTHSSSATPAALSPHGQPVSLAVAAAASYLDSAKSPPSQDSGASTPKQVSQAPAKYDIPRLKFPISKSLTASPANSARSLRSVGSGTLVSSTAVKSPSSLGSDGSVTPRVPLPLQNVMSGDDIVGGAITIPQTSAASSSASATKPLEDALATLSAFSYACRQREIQFLPPGAVARLVEPNWDDMAISAVYVQQNRHTLMKMLEQNKQEFLISPPDLPCECHVTMDGQVFVNSGTMFDHGSVKTACYSLRIHGTQVSPIVHLIIPLDSDTNRIYFQREQGMYKLLGNQECFVTCFHSSICQTASGLAGYFYLDLCDGGTLIDHLPLGPTNLLAQEKSAVCLQIMEILRTLAAKKVVHGDLRPDNLFLIRGSDRKRLIKLGDFNLSTPFDAPEVSLGNAAYRSPEQAEKFVEQMESTKGPDVEALKESTVLVLPEKIDAWWAGCVVYMMCVNNGTPWHAIAQPDERLAVILLTHYKLYSRAFSDGDQANPIDCLLVGLLHPYVSQRFTPDQALAAARNIKPEHFLAWQPPV